MLWITCEGEWGKKREWDNHEMVFPGLHSRSKCPKGGKCNFLHVFRNPDREFCRADRDSLRNASPSSSTRWVLTIIYTKMYVRTYLKSLNFFREKLDWNWSPSSELSIHSNGRRNRVAKEKQNWSWSPEHEPIARANRRSSSRSKENDHCQRSVRHKDEHARSSRNKRKREKIDRSNEDHSSRKKRSKDNRTSRRSRVSSDEGTN